MAKINNNSGEAAIAAAALDRWQHHRCAHNGVNGSEHMRGHGGISMKIGGSGGVSIMA